MSHIVHICYPGIGGQAAVATGLAIEGKLAGATQSIIFYGVEKTADQYIELCDSAGIDHTTIIKQPGIGIGARRKLRAEIKSCNPDVVIAHHHDTCISASFRLLSSACPKVIFVEHHSNALKTKKDWALSCVAHLMSDHTVYLTEAYRDAVKQKWGRFFDQYKTSVIPNGLDLNLYEAISIRDVKLIGMQGRMDSGKDFRTLIAAFAELYGSGNDHGVSLELIGDGPHREELEAYVSELGLSERVRFTGFLDHADLISHMRQWDIAVLSTQGETLSVAILEAWSLAIPLVGTDVPGVGDLIKDNHDGLLVTPLSASSLSENLSRLIHSDSLRKQLAKQGRFRAEREFNRRTIWGYYASLVRYLISVEPEVKRRKILNTLP